jgi:hypothetical protein
MNNTITPETDAARKTLGLLTIREWLAKYKMADAANLVGEFTLDGGRGFVRDEPARLLINTDGTFFVSCGGAAMLRLPGPVCVDSRPPACGGGHYAYDRNGAFYFTINTDDTTGGRPRLDFAEAC